MMEIGRDDLDAENEIVFYDDGSAQIKSRRILTDTCTLSAFAVERLRKILRRR